MPSPYEIAKAGGKHHGFLRQVAEMGPRQRRKSVMSYLEQIGLHMDKVLNPEKHVPDWLALRESHREGLLRGWRKEVADHREKI